MFAEVFACQRGRIFGFGPNANDDTKNVLKVSQNFRETLKKLDQQVDVHNMGEKWNIS